MTRIAASVVPPGEVTRRRNSAASPGLLASIGCGVMGTYVVVKRIAFIAGGIVFFLYGRRQGLPMLQVADAIVAPVGGGGLISGTCLAARGFRKGTPGSGDVRVFAAEPKGADDAARAFARYLQGVEARKSIRDFGYGLPDDH